jgi:hypothetical protein
MRTKKKKEITVVMECESYDERNLREDFIKDDLETEINCCINYYDIKSITFKVPQKGDEQ